MNRTTLPLTSIIVENRQRQDYGDIDELAESISRHGLIQPIIINQDRKLIAGGRRLAAHVKLGRTEIDVVFRETMSQDELHELELEENVRRKEMTWVERVMNILTIHRLKKKRAALEGRRWGQRETAEMMSVSSVSNINYAIRTAELIEKGDKEIIDSPDLSAAWRVVMRREEDALLAELASRTVVNSLPDLSDFDTDTNDTFIAPSVDTIPLNEEDHVIALRQRAAAMGYLSLNETEARTLYLSNPLNPPEEFELYYKEKRESCSIKERDRNTIYLSRLLYNCDSIAFMNHPDCHERFDHIITDIPYGIDMDMLNQQHPEGQMVDIETVLDEHTVDGNEELFKQFFPAAYNCLKPNAFLITWCDFWQARFMADLAIAAGFKVQRWPITWIKAHRCMNQSANTNFTKTTEIALVCRKGTITMAKTDVPCHIVAAHDDLKEKLGHPFVKPFAIWQHLIEAVSLEGQFILEPFAGRGSGVISAIRCKRQVVGCELNPQHFNALVENIKQHYLTISPNFIFA